MTALTDIPLDTILARLRGVEEQLRAVGIDKLYVFGSRARGDARPDSDLDVLVDVDPDHRFGWKNLSSAMAICQDAVGLPTQVTMRRAINARVAERIADDLREVF